MSTTTQPHFSDVGDDEAVRHAKDDAPTEREFELLYQASHALSGGFAVQARFVLLVGGRLGLRAGEIAHFREEWVDWNRSRIEIPAHESCSKGRDGGICGYCEQLAQERANRNPGVTLERAREQRWHPKTNNGVRSVPFDWSERAELVLEQFCERWSEFPHCRKVVNRRVRRLAKATDGFDPDDIYPHALRSHSATYHAGRGVGALALKAFHGWASLQTAQLYLSESPANTQRSLRAAHSR